MPPAVTSADSGWMIDASSRAYTCRRSRTSMEESSAKYWELAALKAARCDSKVPSILGKSLDDCPEVTEGELVSEPIATPAALRSFATSCELIVRLG